MLKDGNRHVQVHAYFCFPFTLQTETSGGIVSPIIKTNITQEK
jgi:hypothetical protein